MELKSWLDAERGRSTALATHLNVSVGRVSQIASGGCPVKFMRAVAEFTGGAVSIDDMVEARTPIATPQPTEPAAAGV